MKNPFKNSNITGETEELKEENIDSKETDEDTSTNEENSNNSENTDNSELNKLKEEYENLNNKYLRLAADFQNFRNRQEGEKENLLRFGMENSLTKLLEVLDNFERAQKSLENVDDIEKYKESISLLHKQTVDTLTKLGLEPIKAQGEEFDPNVHEAVISTPTDEYPEQTIIAELQKGYKYGDKVLRAALVNVATAK